MWTSDYSDGEAAINASLQRLGLDYIDLMILHHSQPANDVAAYQSMEKALREGKLRAVPAACYATGLSNYYTPEDFDRLARAVTIPPAERDAPLSPKHNDEGTHCAVRYGYGAWYPLGGRGHTQELNILGGTT